MSSGSEEAWTEITVFDGFRPPPWQKIIFVLSSGCESRDLQTKPSWIYFQSERGTDDGEGGARFREDRVSEKMHHCFSRKKTHTPKKSKTINYEYHFVHITKTQPDTMVPRQDKTRQKDVVKQVHNGKNEQTEKYLRGGTWLCWS